MLRKNGKINYFLLGVFAIFHSWFNGVLVKCFEDHLPKKCFSGKVKYKNAWIDGGRIISRNKLESESCLQNCCLMPKCDVSVFHSNTKVCFLLECTKTDSCNLRPIINHRSRTEVVIPKRPNNGLFERIHKYDKNVWNEDGFTRRVPEIKISKKFSASKFVLLKDELVNIGYKRRLSSDYRTKVRKIVSSLNKKDNKERIETESRPRRNLNYKPSNNMLTKRYRLNQNITSFKPSLPDDISKEISPQNGKVNLQSSVLQTERSSECRHKVVLRNVRLKHGRKLATFELRGRVGSIVKCLEKCCMRQWCNLAFKVGGYCYAVHCPTDEACEPVKIGNSGTSSDYVMLDRPQSMNYKRNFIPGAVAGQGEKMISIQLNITNENYKAPLGDFESLEFLNVAERVENAISLLLKTAVGFKSCEVASFGPSPLIANVSLTLSNGSQANETGSLLLKAVRAGKMDSTLEDASEHFKLSQAGFGMKTSKGEDLVCLSENNYQNSWSLTMYGAFDQQPCPRNAQGECSRRCLGSENEIVKWDVPNFSGCTSLEFRDLHEKAKQFKSQAQAKLPLDQIEAKAGIKHVEVLEKLQNLTYHHTFREHLAEEGVKNKTNATNPKLHDLHKLMIHKLKSNKTFEIKINEVKPHSRPNPKSEGLLSLTNDLLNIKEKPKEGFDINKGRKVGNEKNDALSIADKIGLLQPNMSLPSSEPVSPGSYHALNQTVQHASRPVQHVSGPVQHAPGSLQHVPGPLQHAPGQVQHAPSLVEHDARQVQRDHHPVQQKGQNRNDISVSVSVSGEFGQPASNETDLSGVFVKSGPDNIRSHIPKSGSRSDQFSGSDSKGIHTPELNSGDKNIAQPIPKADYNSGTTPRGGNSFRPKPETISNTLLNWLNGEPQKSKNKPQPSPMSSLSRSQLSQMYNSGSLRNTKKDADLTGPTRTLQSNSVQSNPVQSIPMQSNPVQSNPVQSNPVQSNPVQSNPVQSIPVQSNPVQSNLVQSNPVQSNPVQGSIKRSLVYNSFKRSNDIRQRLRRQAEGWNRGQNYYTTSTFNSDPRQDNPSGKSVGYSTQTYPSEEAQQRDTSPSYGSSSVKSSHSTADNTSPVNSKDAYFVGIDHKQDSRPEDGKSSGSNVLPDHAPPSSSSPSSSSSSSLPDISSAPPPPPERFSSYQDPNPPPRPLSPLPSSSSHLAQPPSPYSSPVSPPTFEDSNPPHRPLSPPPRPSVYSPFEPPLNSPAYSPSPPQSAPPSPSPSFVPPTSRPPPTSPPPASYYRAPPPPTPPPPSPPPPPAPPPPAPPSSPVPLPPSYSPAPQSSPTTRPTAAPSYYPAPPPPPPPYYPPPPASPPPSYDTTTSTTQGDDSLVSNPSTYQTQTNPNSTYYSAPNSATSPYYTSPATSQGTTSQWPNSQNNSSTYLTQLNRNPTDGSYRNTTKNESPYIPSKLMNSTTNVINNNEYAYNKTEPQGETTTNDFNMKNIGEPPNSDDESWSKLFADYNVTTRPLDANSTKDNSGYNTARDNDYNLTFQKLADNLPTEPPESPITGNATKSSDVSLQNSYKDLGDSQVVVGFTNQTSVPRNGTGSTNDVQELGTIQNGVHAPRLTIEDMKKRIEEFSSGYNDKQAIGDKKTFVQKYGLHDDTWVKGTHLAPMFGGDLLLAADTVKHLAKFNDYIRPTIEMEDVKVFVNACSNILDMMNSREWKNAQRHVAKLNKIGVNIMSDSNAVDWEQASRRTIAGPKNPSTLYEMVEAIEAFGLSASYQVKEPIKEPIITNNIVMELRKIQSDIQEPSPDIVFPNVSDPRIRKWAKQTNVISLSPAALDEVAQGANVEAHVSGVLFKTVGKLSIPVEEGHGNETVESGNLMSMSVFPKITGDLDPPIRITLAHLNPEMSHFKQDCVFLNASASGGEMWSNKGCKVSDVNETHTTCECNHMSSFSLLVDKSRPNDFIAKTTPISTGAGGASGNSSATGSIYIALLFLLILAVIIIIIFAVWRKRKGKSKDEKDTNSAKSGKGSDESKAGASESTTEDSRGQSSKSSSSGDKKKRKKGEGRREGRKKRTKKPHTLDKDAISEENQQDGESKPEDTRSSKKRQQQKEREEQLLMKEKAMIFSDYRQPYNFLAHEDTAPVDSSTPLPATSSKADSYPRRHKRPTSFHDPPPGQPGFNLRKHHSESAFPMQALHRRRGVDSPRDRKGSPQRGSPQRHGSILEGSIREEPLEEQRLAEDTARGSETVSVASAKEKPKKKFWRRKSKDNLDLESIQEGNQPGHAPEQESPKKKKTFFGKKSKSASRTSLNASQEDLGASGHNTQNDPEISEPKNEPPLSPAKKKRFWKRKKSSSQASLDAVSPRPVDSGGISDEGLSGDNELAETPEEKGKRGSVLRRLSKSGSRTSLSKSGSKSSLSKSEDEVEGSPKKRRSSFLGKLSRSGSSLSKSQSSIDGLDSAEEDPGKSPSRTASLLRRLSKSGSRSSLSKSEDSLGAELGEDGSRSSPKRKSSVLRRLSKTSKTGSRRSSKTAEVIPGAVGGDTRTDQGGAEEKLSQSGSTLSLSKGKDDTTQGEGSTPRKKKGLFGKKKSSSRTSLNKPEGENP